MPVLYTPLKIGHYFIGRGLRLITWCQKYQVSLPLSSALNNKDIFLTHKISPEVGNPRLLNLVTMASRPDSSFSCSLYQLVPPILILLPQLQAPKRGQAAPFSFVLF